VENYAAQRGRLSGRPFFLPRNADKKGGQNMLTKLRDAGTAIKRKTAAIDKGRLLYMTFMAPTLVAAMASQAFAADTMWNKASEIMQDVYNQILAISTIAAVVTAAVALLLMNFSKSGKTVDESRAWLKRIIITWVILNSLGFIMAYVTPFFSGGTYTP